MLSPTRSSSRRRPAAFTLIELLVVISIIALIIGILLPTLGLVRESARRTTTTALMSDVINASTVFESEHRRPPGYFPQSEMADPENGEQNYFTNNENVLLDLAGGVVASSSPDPAPENSYVDVFAVSSNEVRVNLNLVGTGEGGGGYLQLGDDVLVQCPGQLDDESDPTITKLDSMVDIVDYFGNPLLIWTRDPTTPANSNTFAAASYDASALPHQRAKYYWAGNAGYLGAKALGADGTPQIDVGTNSDRVSLLAASSLGEVGDELIESMEGVLGSPALPRIHSGEPTGQPLGGRGSFIAISAGPDGVFFAAKDDPNYQAGTQGVVQYAPPGSGNTPDLRRNEVDEFDDLVMSGGG